MLKCYRGRVKVGCCWLYYKEVKIKVLCLLDVAEFMVFYDFYYCYLGIIRENTEKEKAIDG